MDQPGSLGKKVTFAPPAGLARHRQPLKGGVTQHLLLSRDERHTPEAVLNTHVEVPPPSGLIVRVGHAIDDRPNYFRIIYTFCTLTSLLIGPSRVIQGSRFIMWFQWAFILVCAASGLAYYVFLWPDFQETCCIKPNVRRTDLGSCKDALSLIGREIVGISKVKQECGSSTISLMAVYGCFVGSLCIVLVIHAAQIEEALRAYKAAIVSFKGKLKPLVSPVKVLDETADAALFAVDVVTLHGKNRDRALYLYCWPESFLFGWPLIVFHGWGLALLHFLLTLVAAFSIAYYFEIVHKLWIAWGCYAPGTSIDDMNSGICTHGWYKQSIKSYTSIFIGVGTLILKIFIYYVGFVSTRNKRRAYEKHINRLRLVSDNDKEVLINYINDAIGESHE